MWPKMWRVTLRRDGHERDVFVRHLGRRLESIADGSIYEYARVHRDSGTAIADYAPQAPVTVLNVVPRPDAVLNDYDPR